MKVTIRQEDISFIRMANINERCGFPNEPLEVFWGTTWWVARDHRGEAVGFGGIRELTAQPYGYLERAGVAERARGQGLQRRLIRVRLAWAKKQGLKGVITYTLSDNTPSINNLIRCGFITYEPDGDWVGEPGPVIYWMKNF